MTKTLYIEIIASLILVFGTLVIMALLRLLSRKSFKEPRKPSAVLTVFYSGDCECFEMNLERLLRSSAVSGFELTVKVVDLEKTDESRKWLLALQSKLGMAFEIDEN